MMKKLFGLIACLLLLVTPVYGQNPPVTIYGATQTTGVLRPILVDGSGQIILSNPGGTQTDDGAFTLGTTGVVPMGCIEATDSMDAGDVGGVKCGADRELDIDIVGPIIDTQANNIALTQDAIAVAAFLYCYSGSDLDLCVSGDATHDSAVIATGPQVMLGALAYGSDPTAVTAGDAVRWSANRDGVPFVLGGHPNIVSLEAQIQDADGAQTDLALVTCGATCKVAVTFAGVKCDQDTTNETDAVLGFGTANIPSRAHTGAAGIVGAWDGIPPGSGFSKGDGSAVFAVGADGEDLRLTIQDPVGGNCNVEVSYFTIES